MKKTLIRSVFLISVLTLFGLLLWLFLPAPFEVDLVRVSRGPLGVAIHEEGVIRARDRYVVTAPASSRLTHLIPNAGQRVSAGQLLGRLSPLVLSPLEREEFIARIRALQVRAVEAGEEVDRARGNMEQAQREELSAAESLGNSGLAREKHEKAKLALERANALARSAAFWADAAAADLRLAETAFKLSEDGGRVLDLFAPVEGAVTKVFVSAGGVVQAGAKLLEISDTSRLEVVVSVLASDAVKINSGMPMILDKWGGNGVLRIRVREIGSASVTALSPSGVQEQRVNVLADIAGAPDMLADGGRVRAGIVVSDKANVLKVPASAVFPVGQGWAVYALVGNQARRIDILPGVRNAAEVEILSGLEENAIVIADPPAALTDGARVVSRKSKQNRI